MQTNLTFYPLRRLAFVLFSGWVLLWVSAALAAPLVNNNDGTWKDEYNDSVGVDESNNLSFNVFAGVVELIPTSDTGDLMTVPIEPPSFYNWETICLDITVGSGASVTLSVLDGVTETPVAGFNGLPVDPAAPCFDISSINITNHPTLRIQLDVSRAAGLPSPVIKQLDVTWDPKSVLLVDKEAPVTVAAGAGIVYQLRYSVNFVQAENLVIYDTLPHTTDGTVIYPTDYGQNDNPTFGSGTKNPQYWNGPGPLLVDGVSVPARSVYWQLGTVAEGVTDVIRLTLNSKNGTLDGTTVDNTFHAFASNGDPVQSGVERTTITSQPAPNIYKGNASGLIQFPDQYYALPESTVTFRLSDPPGSPAGNSYAPTGRETMYNTVLYDDVSDFLRSPPMIDTNLGDNGFQNISGGGYFDPAYVPPSGGAPFPAIVWTNIHGGTFVPGAGFYETFTVTLSPDANGEVIHNTVCLDSDQTSEICDDIEFLVELNTDVFGVYVKGDDLNGNPLVRAAYDDDPHNEVTYGDTYMYRLGVRNNSFVEMNDVVFVDRIPDEVKADFGLDDTVDRQRNHILRHYAFVHGPDQRAADHQCTQQYLSRARLEYDPARRFIHRDLDCLFTRPQVSSILLPPDDVPGIVYGDFQVQVRTPSNLCFSTLVHNQGLFHHFGKNPAWRPGEYDEQRDIS